MKRLGSEVPRLFTRPLAPLEPRSPETEARTAGYDVIDFAKNMLGVELLPWQKWLLVHALEFRPGTTQFRFRTIVVLVARQNGKTELARVLALWFIYVYGFRLVLGTAQDLDTAEEAWEAAIEYIDPDSDESVPELAREVKKIWRGSGKKSIEWRNGARYKVKAATRSSGRGLSGDFILLDELREHHDWRAWASITKTTMARENALIWCTSNAGDIDSVVLAELRRLAHEALGDPDGIIDEFKPLTFDTTPVDEGEDGGVEEFTAVEDAETLALFEWSAPRDAKKMDREYWGLANPSMGYLIPEQNLLAAARTDPDSVFRMECLCQWVEGSALSPFPDGAWDRGVSDEPIVSKDAELAWCVDIPHDRSAAYVAVAGWREDGEPQVEVAAMLPSAEFVKPWFESRLVDRYSFMRVCFQAKGAPVTSLSDVLVGVKGLEIVDWSGANLGAACGQFYDAVKAAVWDEEAEGRSRPVMVWHRVQPVLDRPAATAVTKPLGDAWVWDRVKSQYDPSPLMAVTGALWLLNQPREKRVSAYEDYGLMTV